MEMVLACVWNAEEDTICCIKTEYRRTTKERKSVEMGEIWNEMRLLDHE